MFHLGSVSSIATFSVSTEKGTAVEKGLNLFDGMAMELLSKPDFNVKRTKETVSFKSKARGSYYNLPLSLRSRGLSIIL